MQFLHLFGVKIISNILFFVYLLVVFTNSWLQKFNIIRMKFSLASRIMCQQSEIINKTMIFSFCPVTLGFSWPNAGGVPAVSKSISVFLIPGITEICALFLLNASLYSPTSPKLCLLFNAAQIECSQFNQSGKQFSAIAADIVDESCETESRHKTKTISSKMLKWRVVLGGTAELSFNYLWFPPYKWHLSHTQSHTCCFMQL